jgi:sec-independent protein translocase protein TatA
VPNIGPFELLVVLVVALLILGPKRLPGAGRALGGGLREFKDSLTGDGKDRVALDGEPPKGESAS